MDKGELRNRKTTPKTSSLKKSSEVGEQFECKNERVERLQSEEPVREHLENVTTGNQKDKVKHYFQSTIDNAVQCLKTDFRFSADEILRIKLEFDFVTVILFVVAFWTRIYKLSQPNNVV